MQCMKVACGTPLDEHVTQRIHADDTGGLLAKGSNTANDEFYLHNSANGFVLYFVVAVTESVEK